MKSLSSKPRIHFVGIGGKGVSLVANFFVELNRILKEHGLPAIILSGSDVRVTERIEKFLDSGQIKINVPQDKYVIGQDIKFAIVTPAVLVKSNPEIEELRRLRIPIIEFSDFVRFLRDVYMEGRSLQKPQELREYTNIEVPSILKGFFAKIKKDLIVQAIKASNILPFYFYNFGDLRLIAVTGTDGKTTTSTMIFHLLEKNGQKVGTITTVGAFYWDGKEKGEFDTGLHQTTPGQDVILKFLDEFKTKGLKYVIFEVTSHALVQMRIAGIKFDTVVYTNITQDHLDYHESLDKYIFAKSLLIRNHTRPDSKIVANCGDKGVCKMLEEVLEDGVITRENIKCYSIDEPVCHVAPIKVLARNVEETLEGIRFDFVVDKGSQKVYLPIFGKYNAANFAAAYLAVEDLVSGQELAPLFTDYVLPSGRMQIMHKKPLVIVDFAHTPNGLENMLKSLKALRDNFSPKGRLIVVFGTAGERDPDKRPKMGAIAFRYADVIILTAEDPRRESLYEINQQIMQGILREAEANAFEISQRVEEYPKAERFKLKNKEIYSFWDESINSRANAIRQALDIAQPEDIIVITGKGHEQSLAFGLTEYDWNDIEFVRQELKKRFNSAL